MGQPDHRGVQRVDRCDVDDPPAPALLDHTRRDGLRAQEQAGEVHIQHTTKRCRVEVGQRDHRVDTGIVDEDVHAAEALDGGAHHALHALGIADVAAHSQSAVGSHGAQSLGRMLAGDQIEIRYEHARTRLV